MSNPKAANNVLMKAECEREVALGIHRRYTGPLRPYEMPKDPTVFFVNGSDPEVAYRDDSGQKTLPVSEVLETCVRENAIGYRFQRINSLEADMVKALAYQNAPEYSGKLVFCRISDRDPRFLDFGNVRNYPLPEPAKAWTPADIQAMGERIQMGAETFEERRKPKSD